MTVVANNLRARTAPDPDRLSCWCGGWGYFHNTAKEPPEFTLCGNCQAAAEKQSTQSHGPHTELIRRLRYWASDGHPHGQLHQEAADALSRSNQEASHD